MENRPKLNIEPNSPTKVTLVFDKPIQGDGRYGTYTLFTLRNGDGSEYSYFAPVEVAEELAKYKKDDEVIITKLAAQRGNKVVTSYSVAPVEKPLTSKPKAQATKESFFSAMEKSFEEAIELQQKFNGMANVNQIAITLFIQRTKGNHSYAT